MLLLILSDDNKGHISNINAKFAERASSNTKKLTEATCFNFVKMTNI
jgi:hypothetical protein